MAIAFDAATYNQDTDTLTWSHTCTGSNRILFLGIVGDVALDSVSGVTYAGAAMTLVDKIQSPADRYNYLFMLVAPASGANDIVVSGPLGNVQAFGVSYTGALQTGQPDAHGTNSSASANSIGKALTTVADNCWIMCHFYFSGGGTPGITSGVIRKNSGSGGDGDLNAVQTPAGSHTITATNSATNNCCILAASFAPAPSNIKTLDTNLRANIKTYNTNPLANIKSIDTNI